MTQKKRKSVKLTNSEMIAFRSWFKKQETKDLAANALGVAPNTIDRVLLAKSGSHETVEKIRKAII